MTDDLNDIDLSAWEAPEPQPGLADAVLTRMHAHAAVEVEGARAGRAVWRWLGVGAVIAAAAAVLVMIVLGRTHAEPGSGEVTADRARRIELGGASADLDAGTALVWHRVRDGLHVTQTRGGAQWHVTDAQLEIDVASASIVATGASLRVEVHMTGADVKVIGASALTSAVVAFATVVVYEGHVRATSAGQTIDVSPGAVIELRPGQPPGPPTPTAREALAVGAGPVAQPTDTANPNDEAAPSPAPKLQTPDSAKRAATTQARDAAENVAALDKVRGRLDACGTKSRWVGTFELSINFDVDPFADFSGRTLLLSYREIDADGNTVQSDESPVFLKCLRDAMPKFPTVAPITYRLTVAAAPGARCNADDLKKRGIDEYLGGQLARAVVALKQSYKCSADIGTAKLIVMVACKADDQATAKEFFKIVPASSQENLVGSCLASSRFDPSK